MICIMEKKWIKNISKSLREKSHNRINKFLQKQQIQGVESV